MIRATPGISAQARTDRLSRRPRALAGTSLPLTGQAHRQGLPSVRAHDREALQLPRWQRVHYASGIEQFGLAKENSLECGTTRTRQGRVSRDWTMYWRAALSGVGFISS